MQTKHCESCMDEETDKELTKIVSKLMKERRKKLRKYEALLFDGWLSNVLKEMYERGVEDGKTQR